MMQIVVESEYERNVDMMPVNSTILDLKYKIATKEKVEYERINMSGYYNEPLHCKQTYEYAICTEGYITSYHQTDDDYGSDKYIQYEHRNCPIMTKGEADTLVAKYGYAPKIKIKFNTHMMYNHKPEKVKSDVIITGEKTVIDIEMNAFDSCGQFVEKIQSLRPQKINRIECRTDKDVVYRYSHLLCKYNRLERPYYSNNMLMGNIFCNSELKMEITYLKDC
jgi:hypothetical protein